MKPRSIIVFLSLCAMLLIPYGALADSISPGGVKALALVGDTLTIDKTVTVSQEPDPLITYSSVSLDVSLVPNEISASFSPAAYLGAFDRSIDRDFLFTVMFGLLEPGDYTFRVFALVDGERVAEEVDGFHVAPVPVPGAALLLGSGLLAMSLRRFRRKKKV